MINSRVDIYRNKVLTVSNDCILTICGEDMEVIGSDVIIGTNESVLYRLDLAGNITWSFAIGDTNTPIDSVIIDSRGNIICSSTGSTHIFIFDINGNVVDEIYPITDKGNVQALNNSGPFILVGYEQGIARLTYSSAYVIDETFDSSSITGKVNNIHPLGYFTELTQGGGAYSSTLYNWYAVDSAKLAPIGWKVPSTSDWNTLVTYIEGMEYIGQGGGLLKEVGTTHWEAPNEGAVDAYGFTALPGGYRNDDGAFQDINYNGYWWSSIEYVVGAAWCKFMDFNDVGIGSLGVSDSYGFSIRCMRDTDPGVSTITDIDGNAYGVQQIGTQWWLTSDLKVTHYNNGDSIPNVIDFLDWSHLTTGAYCYYDNTPPSSDGITLHKSIPSSTSIELLTSFADDTVNKNALSYVGDTIVINGVATEHVVPNDTWTTFVNDGTSCDFNGYANLLTYVRDTQNVIYIRGIDGDVTGYLNSTGTDIIPPMAVDTYTKFLVSDSITGLRRFNADYTQDSTYNVSLLNTNEYATSIAVII